MERGSSLYSLSTSHMPGSVLRSLHTSFDSTTPLQDRDSYSYFPNRGTEAQRGYVACLGSLTRSQLSNVGLSGSESGPCPIWLAPWERRVIGAGGHSRVWVGEPVDIG